MNTDNSASLYAQRAIRDLGLQANDTERALIWAWDNPPRYPIEKVRCERTRQIFLSQKVFACLRSIARSMSDGENVAVDAIADALLCRVVKNLAPNAWEMHQRHEAEARALLDELRRNSPNEEQPRPESYEHYLNTQEK